mmetsp:Transcript_2295/g.4915  ORF Transcript_2295/g.4915 Transcript_2295/m.4915 type:complete len:355 (+) Transcript_2295:1445-2509(+)
MVHQEREAHQERDQDALREVRREQVGGDRFPRSGQAAAQPRQHHHGPRDRGGRQRDGGRLAIQRGSIRAFQRVVRELAVLDEAAARRGGGGRVDQVHVGRRAGRIPRAQGPGGPRAGQNILRHYASPPALLLPGPRLPPPGQGAPLLLQLHRGHLRDRGSVHPHGGVGDDLRRDPGHPGRDHGADHPGGGHLGAGPAELGHRGQAGPRRHGGVLLHRLQHLRRGLRSPRAVALLLHRHTRQRLQLWRGGRERRALRLAGGPPPYGGSHYRRHQSLQLENDARARQLHVHHVLPIRRLRHQPNPRLGFRRSQVQCPIRVQTHLRHKWGFWNLVSALAFERLVRGASGGLRSELFG